MKDDFQMHPSRRIINLLNRNNLKRNHPSKTNLAGMIPFFLFRPDVY